jgi:hypothetical protein
VKVPTLDAMLPIAGDTEGIVGIGFLANCKPEEAMKKSLTYLAVVLVMVVAFSVTPVAAAPKLAGTWGLTSVCIEPDGTINNNTMDMTISATAIPTLFYGTITGGDPDLQLITIMMDAGANMHFAVSWTDSEGGETEPRTHTFGRGTASTSKIVGSWSNDLGFTGSYTATRK